MSLKTFHVIFISLSIVLAVATSIWALSAYAAFHTIGYLALGVLSLGGTVALVAYEVRFLRKCRASGIE